MACENGCINGPAKITDLRRSVTMRKQLMRSVDERTIEENLAQYDFDGIDMTDGKKETETPIPLRTSTSAAVFSWACWTERDEYLFKEARD